MPKFFINSNNVKENKIRIEQDYNHIKNVLRKNIGDKLQVCNKQTQENYNCEISAITDKYVECNIIEEMTTDSESSLKITIYQGLPKSEKMEMVIQKSIELGVYEITPVEMSRCVVKLKEKDKQKKIERWKKIAEVAAKQCGRNIIPNVNQISNIDNICKNVEKFDSIIVAYEDEKNYSIKSEIARLKKKESIDNIAIVIGPEGGFDNEEIKKMKEAGANIVTLGKRILRTETVALALTSIIMYELGDLN